MDIEKLIEREAPSESKHDKTYASHLRIWFNTYKYYSLEQLRQERQSFKIEQYHGTHDQTAQRVVVFALIKELTKEDNVAWEWVEKYSDGGEMCIECSQSRPVTPGSGHECIADHYLDCPALPEEFYTTRR